LIAVMIAAAACGGRGGPETVSPVQDGRALLERMRTAYVGKWFKTVTFVQQTIRKNPQTGVTDTTTWYEALKSPDRLRIDFGDPKNGNGVMYTADSVYVVRGGKVTRAAASGNPFLPFVAGVYAQPLASTLRQIAPYKFDLTKLYTRDWEGRPTYVAGASSASDTTSPQFWIDKDRLIVTRMLLHLNPAAPDEVADIRLEDYRPVAGGWLAVKVEIMEKGEVRQKEDYSDWKGNVALPADFFVAEKWSQVPHWTATPGAPR
jgi:outer membrane lipoprotein-sorting protein